MGDCPIKNFGDYDPMTVDYTPNHIPRTERFLNVLYALAIIIFGAIGLTTGELLIPGKRTSGPNGIALQGFSAWAMYAAMICACVVLLSVVADHYDRRNNEFSYRRFARIGKILGWSFFILSLALYAFG
jgi:TRAP-type C4-dicarboxylate transport system permease small subunit